MNALLFIVHNPLFWIVVTFSCFLFAEELQMKCGRSPLLNPLLLATLLLVVILQILHIPYANYFDSVKVIHFMLPPATVALSMPLFLNLRHIKSAFTPMIISLLIGSIVGIVSVIMLSKLFGLSSLTIRSMAPKSVTTAIAMVLSENVGGNPGLAANIVILTGVLGAASANTLLYFMRSKNHMAQGFSIGLTAHGVGTAQAFQISETAGAFAGLGMGLNGLVTSILLPLILWLWPV